MWPRRSFDLQPCGRRPHSHDEPERSGSVPGDSGLLATGQRERQRMFTFSVFTSRIQRRLSSSLLQLPDRALPPLGNDSSFPSFCTRVQTGSPSRLSLLLLLKLQTTNYSYNPMMEQRDRAPSLISSKNRLSPPDNLRTNRG